MATNSAANTNYEELVHWQKGPSERGGFSIIWKCIAIIITCTWTALHLNVPASSDGVVKTMARKAKWMCITIFLPEFVFAHAVIELRAALDDVIKMAKNANFFAKSKWCVHQSRKIHMLHTMLSAPSTLFRLTTDDAGTATLDNHKCTEGNEREPFLKWTLSHSYLANMGGLEVDDEITLGSCYSTYFIGRRYDGNGDHDISTLMEEIRLMNISKRDIQDKGKADNFIRILWLWQILQLVIELSTRAAQDLPITQLEIITASFSLLTFITVLVQASKPQSVGQPFHIRTRKAGWREPTDFQFFGIASLVGFYLGGPLRPETPNDKKRVRKRVRNDSYRPSDKLKSFDYDPPEPLFPIMFSLATVVFGLVHCGAWNFQFPTAVEKWIWRSCTVAGIALPFIMLFVSLIIEAIQSPLSKDTHGDTAEECMKKVIDLVDPSVRRQFHDHVYLNRFGDPGFTEKWIENVSGSQNQALFRSQIEKMNKLADKSSAGLARLKKLPRIRYAMQIPSLFVYLLTRLAIIAVAFSSFRRAPRGIYRDTWAGLLPSIS